MKAKKSGVKQFIFMSSAIVYGDSAPIGKMKMITKDTPFKPANCYGDSKVKAERGLKKLEDENFKVVILYVTVLHKDLFGTVWDELPIGIHADKFLPFDLKCGFPDGGIVCTS